MGFECVLCPLSFSNSGRGGSRQSRSDSVPCSRGEVDVVRMKRRLGFRTPPICPVPGPDICARVWRENTRTGIRSRRGAGDGRLSATVAGMEWSSTRAGNGGDFKNKGGKDTKIGRAEVSGRGGGGGG